MKGDFFETDYDEGYLHIPNRDESQDDTLIDLINLLVGKTKPRWGSHAVWDERLDIL